MDFNLGYYLSNEGGSGATSTSPYIEMEARRSDSYQAFALKAAKKCQFATEPDKELCLLKLNGARILDEPITVRCHNRDYTRPWTLGNHFLLMKKAPSLCRIGVAYAAKLNVSSEESVSVKTVFFQSASHDLTSTRPNYWLFVLVSHDRS